MVERGRGASGRIRTGLLVSAATLVVVLVLLEAVTRYSVHAESQRAFVDLASGSRSKLGTIKQHHPNHKILYDLQRELADVEFKGALVSTDAAGFRRAEPHGPSRPREKPPGTVRVLGIGDSTMFGWGVRYEECYLARLEGLLQAACPARRWEVINTGVPGYNTVMEVESLRVKGVAFDRTWS